MAKLAKFNDIVQKYGHIADFLLIYIKEAHPTDGWHFKSNAYCIESAKNMTDRAEAAKFLRDENVRCPLVLDDVTDEAVTAYCSFPERLYIVLDGVIVLVGGIGPEEYDLQPVEEWLVAYSGQG
ncbi:thyroxine 5-deiodinase-like [Haliotis rubra]|uniref:thyroxine 5-deiodinase-like n=1 Tax=Haliotis rubra TaxID=36100 RepID=UPI001EE5F168|nr:thyroxine 5-deiodinase-like [Haliotis rubra]